jgi:hypothetical protein
VKGASPVSRRCIEAAALGQAALCLAASLASREAAIASLVISALTWLRYLFMGLFVGAMTSRSSVPAALAAGGWIAALGAAALALVVVLLRRPSAIPWAVGAACIGPVVLALACAAAGCRLMILGARGGT